MRRPSAQLLGLMALALFSSNSWAHQSATQESSEESSRESLEASTESSLQASSEASTQGTSGGKSGNLDNERLGVAFIQLGSIGELPKPHRLGQRREQRARHFLERYHAMIVRDLVAAKGPTLERLIEDLELTPKERTAFRTALDGSTEQLAMLLALRTKRTLHFAQSFRRLVLRAIGTTRLASSVLVRSSSAPVKL